MHHGYQWLDKRDFILSGIVRQFYFGNPHITLRVQAKDGLWLVESTDVLGASLSGFGRHVLDVGDPVTVYGYRSRDPRDKRMRGDKIEARGHVYVLFPADVFGPPFTDAPD